ncbi:MAG: hypothetical protein ACRD18_02955, partial [Terriglobia bacterium]
LRERVAEGRVRGCAYRTTEAVPFRIPFHALRVPQSDMTDCQRILMTVARKRAPLNISVP